ncbi:MAG TPA: CsgG/HfaB family protein [Atribacterota bacterium]|nr:CsgG/HfaB family protein [Atribacterota bacterium]
MVKRINILVILVMVLFLLCIISVSSAQLPRVAVLGVDSTAPGYTWRMDSGLSYNATELLVNTLVNDGRFEVYERSRLEEIIDEIEFQHYSGLVDPNTAVRIGQLAGVDIVVSGRVSNVQFSKGGSLTLGAVKLKKSSTKVSMTVRAIEVATGRILFSTMKDESASRTGVSARLRLPIPGGISFSKEEAENILDVIAEICEKVVDEFGHNMAVERRSQDFSKRQDLEGYIVEVMATSGGELVRVYTNLGEDTGIQVGDKIEIYKEGNAIVDPITNEVLDRELDLIAIARITSVKEKLSIALVEQRYGASDIIKTDMVKLIL